MTSCAKFEDESSQILLSPSQEHKLLQSSRGLKVASVCMSSNSFSTIKLQSTREHSRSFSHQKKTTKTK